MAIRVTYGDVADYARLGVMAGQARAATEAVERQAAMDRQVMQIQAQRASQERAQEHQKQMAEFDAFLDTQKYQRAEAFELEKMELRSRHDFEMVEAKREADFQYQLQREQARKQEMEAKLKALASKAPVEMGGDGFLSAEQYRAGYLKITTGASIPKVSEDWMGNYMRGVVSPVPPTPAKLRAAGKLPALDPRVEAARAKAAEAERAVAGPKALGPETAKKVEEIIEKIPTLDPVEQAEMWEVLRKNNPVLIDE